MKFKYGESKILEGAFNYFSFFGNDLPFEFEGPRREFLAARETAWFGVSLNFGTIYRVTGPDAAKLLTQTCVNRDFSKLKIGGSRHAIICDEQGLMMADGVIIREGECDFKTDFLAPVLHYYLMTSGLDVQGEFINNEFIYQLDGPKSLEIMEEAAQCDLHDLKFAQNKYVTIAGHKVQVHRLGMSGALAYEMHGDESAADDVYVKMCEVLKKYGGVRQGFRNYAIVNHTPGGYPNQFIHFMYAFPLAQGGLGEFLSQNGMFINMIGSAAKDYRIFVTPYDIGWGYLVNFDHDFIGKEALQKIAQDPPKTVVTLEWDADDVAEVFASQFRGKGVEIYDPIEGHTNNTDATDGQYFRADFVCCDGKRIGIAVGKTYAYYENRMISLAILDKEYADLGKELEVEWGSEGYPIKMIKATVAPMPYYNGKYRNETFDVNEIPKRF